MKELSLCSNHIQKIENLPKSLTQLYIRRNQIQKLENLPENLTQLYIRYNKIQELENLPKNLTQLSISYNQIKTLDKLPKNIERLDIRHNKITKIVGLPQSLHLIFLGHNQIKDLSSIVDLFEKNIHFDWFPNPFETPPIPIIEQGQQAILDYFNSLKGLKPSEEVFFSEIKILLVGEGMSGKTSLLKQIKGLKFNLEESQTHGVIIEQLALKDLPVFRNYPELKEVSGRFWDFGGQEIMHASHQFFLTNRSVYIFVLDSRTDAKKEYWLKHIEKYGGDNSDVFVAINKIDENKNYDVERKTLNKKYPFLQQRFHRISCQTGEGIENLLRDIAESIPESEILKTPISIYWRRVKEDLEKATALKHYIDQRTFVEICENHSVTGTAQKTLLGFLNDLGIILHFKNLELSEFYVLDPHWVTIGVYKIINSQLIKGGVLEETQLDDILNKEQIKKQEYDPIKNKPIKYKGSEQLYLLNIMQEFELLHPFIKGKYLVPDLLPKEALSELPIDVNSSEHIHFIIEYDFLPTSIMTRFIIRMREDIFNFDHLWRTGIVLTNQNTAALAVVYAEMEDRRIKICVSGESKEKRDYFAFIHLTLMNINKTFQKLQIRRFMTVPGHPEIEVDYDELFGLERMNEDELPIGKIGKRFSVSKDFLDKINTKQERMENRERPNQTFNIYGGNNQGIGQNENFRQKNFPPPPENPKPPKEASTPKNWYDSHWLKSFGKAFLVAIPVAILGHILKGKERVNFNFVWEISAIAFCLAALFFINRDPKYKFYRGGMFCLSLIGFVNILPMIKSQFKFQQENIDFLFELGIQENWYVSVGLFVVALFLFWRQK